MIRVRMALKVLAVSVVTAMGIVFLQDLAHAQIVLEMGGNPACTRTSMSPHDTLTLTNVTCQDSVSGNIITISNSGGTARIEREANPADSTIDQLRLTNAKITTNGPVQNFHLTFWRTFAQGPNFLPTTTYYRTKSMGTITQTNPPGNDPGDNSIAATGYVANPTTGPFLQMGVQKVYVLPCPPTCSSTFDMTTSQLWPRTPNPPYHDLTGNRMAKVDIVLTLFNANDSVDLGTNSIKINSQGQPDDGIEDIGTGYGDPGDQIPISSRCLSIFVTCITATTKGTSQNLFQTASLMGAEPPDNQAKLTLFAKSNWHNLLQDFARGKGEHLASLAALLNIPANRQSEFFDLAQALRRTSTASETPEQVVASLYEMWGSQ
jgi:hypothetical protein